MIVNIGMARFILFLVLLMSAVYADTMAQSSDARKGPQAKNQKAWNTEASDISTVTKVRGSKAGPAAKNLKAWESEHTVKLVAAAQPNTSRKFGAQAKNVKAWEDEEDLDEANGLPRIITPILLLIILSL